jgi:uncharacterized short protein YbdD (DUF466 family)
MKETWLEQMRGAYHGIFGVPDYDAYLRHMRERHPGKPVWTREQFAREWIDRRYGRMRGRCC